MHRHALTRQPTNRITQADPIAQCHLPTRSLIGLSVSAPYESSSVNFLAVSCQENPNTNPTQHTNDRLVVAHFNLKQQPDFVSIGAFQ